MNILHINTRQTAGAALCAMRISHALEEQGIDSRMLFAEGETMPKGVSGAIAERDKSFWYSHPWLLRLKYLLARLPLWSLADKEKMEVELQRRNKLLEKPLYLHGPSSSYKNIAHHPLVEWADIIHLHWVANFIDYPTFFQEVQKPIVWTLHDLYPAVGALHFESSFYPVPESLKAIDAYCRKVKRDSIMKAQNLNIVAISEVMAEACNHSDVLQDFPVTLIHNGVDTNVFHPFDKQEARRELGLPNDMKILLFSANCLDDENKGLGRLIKALESLDTTNLMLVCMGLNNQRISLYETRIPIIYSGYINDQTKAAKYYSAADYLIQCSYIESFGQTLIEAMACGTPVVSTNSGVAAELIQPFNGVLCDGFDSHAIVSGIKQALSNNYDATAIRQYIIDHYRYDIIAEQYIKLYKSIIASWQTI